MRFQKHYSPASQARALLPLVRNWLEELGRLRIEMENLAKQFEPLLRSGADVGGPPVNNWLRALLGLQEVATEFHRREIQIKDLDRGLIDFPAFVGGKEVFLCWEQGEEDIEFWHDLDAGYAGRERLEEP